MTPILLNITFLFGTRRIKDVLIDKIRLKWVIDIYSVITIAIFLTVIIAVFVAMTSIVYIEFVNIV